MSDSPVDSPILGLTAQIVAAHAANNLVDTGALPSVIRAVYSTLSNIGDEPAAAPAEKPQPAVPIRKSVFPDYIVCLEDGKKLKMLKRHLSTSFNMTPEQYPAEMGPGCQLPDGRAELRRTAFNACQGDRPGYASGCCSLSQPGSCCSRTLGTPCLNGDWTSGGGLPAGGNFLVGPEARQRASPGSLPGDSLRNAGLETWG